MPNDVFEFKRFSIKQDKCAMKVGTDAVLLGSWVNPDHFTSILDIGTGTGVIALMLAQKSNANITALEIDANSFVQAGENVANSSFKDQIKVIRNSFQDFWKQESAKFDLVVTNPPYFIDSLKSNDTNRSTARHADVLPFSELVDGVKELLSANGVFCLILPKKEAEIFRKMAEQKGFFLTRLMRVRNSPDKEDDKRHLMQFELAPKDIGERVFYIRTTDPQAYSDEYKQLTKDYYMNF